MKNLAYVPALAFAFTLTLSAGADLASYSQDFEGMDMSDPSALDADGWLVFGNVYDGGGGFLYNYGPFGAPNGTPGFSSVATGSGGANQGLQYLNVYSDYNNGDHGSGLSIESNVYQEQLVGATDLGQTWDFGFDFKGADSGFNPAGSSNTLAFIKVVDPNAGSLVAFNTLDTTNAAIDAWSEGNSLSITIDPAWNGFLLQFGFLTNGTNFDPSGIYYDNISFDQQIPAPASLAVLAMGALGSRRRRTRNAVD